MIKTGGANVSPVEVDAVLESLPGVRIRRTVGVPHPTLGELVVACIVANPGVELSEDHLREYARTRLASYKAPRRILFVAEDQLALTGSSKIKTLRELATKRLAGEAHLLET